MPSPAGTPKPGYIPLPVCMLALLPPHLGPRKLHLARGAPAQHSTPSHTCQLRTSFFLRNIVSVAGPRRTTPKEGAVWPGISSTVGLAALLRPNYLVGLSTGW